jgi:hypothetical protein
VTAKIVSLGEQHLLPGALVGHHVAQVWRSPEPTIEECLRLIETLSHEGARRRGVAQLASRAFAAGDIDSPQALDLAHRLLALLGQDPRDPVVADALLVKSARQVADDLAAACAILGRTEGRGTAKLARLVAKRARRTFAAQPPGGQAEILAREDVAGRFRRELVAQGGRRPWPRWLRWLQRPRARH